MNGEVDGIIKDVLYESPSFHGVDIKAATFAQLMRRCLCDFDANGPIMKNPSFSFVFFLTYQWYLEPLELLDMFGDLYNSIFRSSFSEELQRKRQICQCISYWVNTFGNDFQRNSDTRKRLQDFQDLVRREIGGESASLLNVEKWVLSRKTQKFRLESGSASGRRTSLSFYDMKAQDIAEQLTYLEWKIAIKIPVIEWRDYSKEAKTENTQFLKKQISMFNNVSKWVISMVLTKTSAQDRARYIRKFIQVAKHLKSLGNYNSLLAVMGGLNHSVITRLNKTREHLSSEDKLFIGEMMDLLSSKGNYTKYRRFQDSNNSFCIPLLGVVMKDLIAVETAVPDFLQNGQLIHFHKMVQIREVLRKVIDLSGKASPVSPNKERINMLRLSLQPRITEDELYELSLEREPRSVCKSPLPTNEPVFADWAAGVCESLTRNTVEKYVNSMVEAVFKIYDRDKNGKINEKEFEAIASNFPFLDNFASLDTNCDGVISKEEMKNYFMNVNSNTMTRDFVHTFEETAIFTPTYCDYCMGFLWGLGKTASRCRDCNVICHKDCKNHIVLECRPTRTSTMSSKDKEKPVKFRTLKKRLKYVEQYLASSTDSQLSQHASESPEGTTPVPNGDLPQNSLVAEIEGELRKVTRPLYFQRQDVLTKGNEFSKGMGCPFLLHQCPPKGCSHSVAEQSKSSSAETSYDNKTMPFLPDAKCNKKPQMFQNLSVPLTVICLLVLIASPLIFF